MPKQSFDPRNYLYHSLSQTLNTNAIFPPKPEQDLKNFDIVLINPDGPKGSMLEGTDANLHAVLTEDEKQQLTSQMECYNHGETNLSSIDTWGAQGKIHLQSGLASLGPEIAFNSRQVVDLAIVNAETTRIEQGNTDRIEGFIFKYFPKLIATTIGRHVKKRFFIGVITGVTKGKIDAISEQVRDVAATTSVGTGVPVDGLATVQGRVENRRQLFGEGIIGVNMICFPIKTNPDIQEFKIGQGIRVVQINDEFKEARKYLRSGRGPSRLIGLRRRSEHLFAVHHISSAQDLDHDQDMKEEYVKLTKLLGGRLGTEDILDEQKKLGLIPDFGGVMGRDLWTKDVSQAPNVLSGSSDTSPYLVINGIEGLNEINEDDDIRWMKMPSCTIVADV